MIFEVTPDHIAALSDEDLRDLVGRLCEAELTTAALPTVGVTYGGNQNAPDGGIDVRVESPALTSGGHVPRAITGFQVKAEDMPRAAIMKEMRPNGCLRGVIAAIGASGGSYVVVSSKGSVSDRALNDRRRAMRDAVADVPAATGMHLDFYDRQRIASWVNGHKGVVAWVRLRVNEPLSGWRSFDDWSSSPEATNAGYLLDDGARVIDQRAGEEGSMAAIAGIERIRAILARPGGTVRLVGLPGPVP